MVRDERDHERAVDPDFGREALRAEGRASASAAVDACGDDGESVVNEMDEKDLKILFAIAERKSGSPEVIQSETGIPKSTIHYRLENLREQGIIQNDLYDIDAKSLGLTITVISEVWAEYQQGYHHEIGESLSAVEGVNQVYFTMGETDFVVISHLTSQEMAEELISSFEGIEGIQRTSSKFVITTVKDEPNILNDFELETLADALV